MSISAIKWSAHYSTPSLRNSDLTGCTEVQNHEAVILVFHMLEQSVSQSSVHDPKYNLSRPLLMLFLI